MCSAQEYSKHSVLAALNQLHGYLCSFRSSLSVSFLQLLSLLVGCVLETFRMFRVIDAVDQKNYVNAIIIVLGVIKLHANAIIDHLTCAAPYASCKESPTP